MLDRLRESCELKPMPVAKEEAISDIEIIDPHSSASLAKPCLHKAKFLNRQG